MFADVPGYGSGSTPYYWVWTNDLTFFLKSVEYSTSQIKTLVPWIDDNLACLCSNINLGFLQKEMNHLSEWDKHHKVIRVIRVRGILWNKGLRPATLFKKRLWHRCFLVNVVKFLRTPFLQNTSGRLLEENLQILFFDDYTKLFKKFLVNLKILFFNNSFYFQTVITVFFSNQHQMK